MKYIYLKNEINNVRENKRKRKKEKNCQNIIFNSIKGLQCIHCSNPKDEKNMIETLGLE